MLFPSYGHRGLNGDFMKKDIEACKLRVRMLEAYCLAYSKSTDDGAAEYFLRCIQGLTESLKD